MPGAIKLKKGDDDRGRPNRYDWEKWFALGKVSLRKGRDYLTSQSSMVNRVRNHGSKYGYAVSVRDLGDSIEVTFTKRTEVLDARD